MACNIEPRVKSMNGLRPDHIQLNYCMYFGEMGWKATGTKGGKGKNDNNKGLSLLQVPPPPPSSPLMVSSFMVCCC